MMAANKEKKNEAEHNRMQLLQLKVSGWWQIAQECFIKVATIRD